MDKIGNNPEISPNLLFTNDKFNISDKFTDESLWLTIHIYYGFCINIMFDGQFSKLKYDGYYVNFQKGNYLGLNY